MSWNTKLDICCSGLPLLLGLTIAFVVFSGNLETLGFPVPLNQPIRFDYIFGILTVLFGTIVTFDLAGAIF